MYNDIGVVSERRKGKPQEVLTVMVMKEKGEFGFNYGTSRDPSPDHLELLKNFRNFFTDKLKELDNKLGSID